MQFENKTFILAGKFQNGDKSVQVKQMIEMCGGSVKKGLTVSNNVDYIVLGSNGSSTWKDGICPQAIEAETRSNNGQDIEVITEETLFNAMAKAGTTKAKWMSSYNKRIKLAYESLDKTINAIKWSYNNRSKTLTIEDSLLPDIVSLIEDAEIVGFHFELPPENISSLFDEASDDDLMDEEEGDEGTEEETSNERGAEEEVGDEDENEDERDKDVRLRGYGPDDIKKMLPWAKYSNVMEHVEAPNLIEVPPDFFAWSQNLKSASLPVARVIRSGAFFKCKLLESVCMPEVVFIGNGSFFLCSSLKGRLVLRKLEHIGPRAFMDCTNLTALSTTKSSRVRADGKTIQGTGNSLELIGDGAFINCLSLKTVGFDREKAILGKDVFYNCPVLSTSASEEQ